MLYSLIGMCKLNGVEAESYLLSAQAFLSQEWRKSLLYTSGHAARISHMSLKSLWPKNHCCLVPMWRNWRVSDNLLFNWRNL